MRKFSVNTGQKKTTPTEEQIRRQKDFARLHHEYERLVKRGKKPLYRDPKLWMLLFIIGLVLYLAFFEA
jgi:hypothetical protein